MKRKPLMWTLFASAYLMQLPFFIWMVTLMFTDATSEWGVVVEVVSLVFAAVTLVLCFLNLISAALNYNKEKTPPYKLTAAVKCGLIPFYIINFFIWGMLILGFALTFILVLSVVFWVVSVLLTYTLMLSTGFHNIAFLIKRTVAEKKIRYVVYLILHFIFIADVFAAVVLCAKEREIPAPDGVKDI